MIKILTQSCINCTYITLNSLPFIIQRVSKTFLDAECMYFNGYMLGLSGTSTVASISSEKQIPVVAFCESYKFSKKAMLDSIYKDEVETHEEIIRGIKIKRERHVFDITSAKFINMVSSEEGNISAVSVPIVIRELEKYNE